MSESSKIPTILSMFDCLLGAAFVSEFPPLNLIAHHCPLCSTVYLGNIDVRIPLLITHPSFLCSIVQLRCNYSWYQSKHPCQSFKKSSLPTLVVYVRGSYCNYLPVSVKTHQQYLCFRYILLFEGNHHVTPNSLRFLFFSLKFCFRFMFEFPGTTHTYNKHKYIKFKW